MSSEDPKKKKSECQERMDRVIIDKSLFCRICGNSGKMILLRNRVSGQFARPGDFSGDPRLDIYEHACQCCHGELQCAMSGEQHKRLTCERMVQYAFPPAFRVFERAGKELQKAGYQWPTEEATRVEFATLREHGWLFWACETARAQVAACERNHKKGKE